MARPSPALRSLTASTTRIEAADAKVVAYHYSGASFAVPPRVPVAFARDFRHVLFAPTQEIARELEAHNPNRSLFAIADQDSACSKEVAPDLVSVLMTPGGFAAMLKDQELIAASALCILLRPDTNERSMSEPSLPAIFGDGFRSVGITDDGFLFVRELSSMKQRAQVANDLSLRIWKLAFLCIALGHASCALEWLRNARERACNAADPRLAFRTYDRLLRDLISASDARKAQPEAVPGQVDENPLVEHHARVASIQRTARRLNGALAVLNGNVPPLLAVPGMRTREVPASAYWMLPRILRPVAVAVRRVQRAIVALNRGIPVAESYRREAASAGMTPLEAKLDAYGFPALARRLRGVSARPR